jgi:hypothetical protein
MLMRIFCAVLKSKFALTVKASKLKAMGLIATGESSYLPLMSNKL